MNQPSGTLYEIRWNEVFPTLILVRALRVSVMVRVLVLALVGVVMTHWGWSSLEGMFTDDSLHLPRLQQQSDLSNSTVRNFETGANESKIMGPLLLTPNAERVGLPVTNTSVFFDNSGPIHWGGPLVRAWAWLSEPFVRLARSASMTGLPDSRASGWRYSLVLFLCGIWAIIVWAIIGGAISRIAALHLTRGETLGPIVALYEAKQKWAPALLAPLIPLLGAILLAIPLMLAGLLLRTDLFSLGIGLVWIFVVVWGFLLAVLLIGLLVGWPLMWATIGVERTDAFDGVSRCYAYVYQRPMHLVCYVAFAGALGWLGQIAVEYFAIAAVVLGEWAVSWGAGGERIADLTASEGNTLTGMAAIGAKGIRFWKEVLQILVASYALAYLWSAAVGIYLLLRRQVDSTEMDEVAIEESAERLPQLEDDPSGVPSMQSEPTTSDLDEDEPSD